MSVQGSSGHDSGLELFWVLVVAVIAGPMLLVPLGPGYLAAARIWLLAHHLLVAPPQALLNIPGLNAGLDLRRLLIFALTLLALGCALSAWRHASSTRKKERS